MKLAKVTPTEFASFSEMCVQRLAEQRSEENDRTIEICLPEAKAEFNGALPQGLNTPDHYIYYLKDDDGTLAGWLWYGVREKLGKKRAFIFDILVFESFRGRGLGKYMLSWLDKNVIELGLDEISLHVLGSNSAARKLYENMGYAITNLYMAKKLSN